MSSAEIAINGLDAEILLKADTKTVDNLGSRVTGAELEIDGLNSEITLKANKVYVDAQITAVKKLIADEIEAVMSDVELSIAGSIVTKELNVTTTARAVSVVTNNFTLGGSAVSKTTIPVVTAFTQASGESAPRTDYTLLTTDAGSDEECTAGNGETVTF
jgi:hypothetical protein